MKAQGIKIGLILMAWLLAFPVSDLAPKSFAAEKNGQPEKADSILRISGKILNVATSEPVGEVEVRVAGSSVTTITNEDGYFLLKSPKNVKTVSFAALGFHSHSINLSTLSSTENLTILLRPSATILQGVSVYSAENIVLSAIGKIAENYPSKQMLYKTFYRETVKKRSRYVSVIEAVQDIYKRQYTSDNPDLDKVYVEKGRRLISDRSRDTIAVHVEGGPNESLYLDLVKNREFFLNEQMMNFYQFALENSQTIGERVQYVVSFKPIYSHYLDYPYTGLMFIDAQTLAFTRIELSLDCSDRTKATNFMLRRKPIGLRFRPRGLESVVSYSFDGEKSHISYIRNVFDFGCDWKKRGLYTHYVVTSENLVTSREEVEERPRDKRSFSRYDVLDKKVGDFIDPLFWENFNILEPSESLEYALRKLIKRAVD